MTFCGSGNQLTMSTLIRLLWLVLLASTPALVAAADPLVSLEGPDVTIIGSQERTIYEYRQNGQLRMVKIVPKWGKPYFLVPADPTKGYGDLEQAERLIPSWKVIEF